MKTRCVVVMPSSFSVIDDIEMIYVEGGSKNVDMSPNFLDKTYCSWYASMMLSRSEVTDVEQNETAKELFAHARCYYLYDSNGVIYASNPLAKGI